MKKYALYQAALTVPLCCCGLAAAQGLIGASFTGSQVDETGAILPQLAGAAGANHFVEFIDGIVNIFPKTGGDPLLTMDDTEFWTDAGLSNFTIYPVSSRLIYDHASQRWFAGALDGASGTAFTGNNFLVAVSDTSDPTQGWKAFRFNIDSTGDYYADRIGLGVNADGVFLSGNVWRTSDDTIGGVTIISIPKAHLLLPTPSIASRTTFQRVSHSTYGYGPQPVTNFGPSTGRGPVLAVDYDIYHRLDRANVLGAGGAGATLSAAVEINVKGINDPATAEPPNARQPDGTSDLDTDDDRLGSTAYQVGNILWTAHTILSNNRAAVRFYKIDETTNTVLLQATLADANHDTFYPSIAANEFGDVVIGFNRSGAAAGEYVSSHAVVGSTNGSGVTSFTPVQLLKEGVANYHEDWESETGTNYWGDYTSTTVDPADPSIFWTHQQWVSSLNKWSSQITEIITPRPGEVRWKNPAGGSFGATSNWLSGALPTAAQQAVFSVASNYTVTFGGNVSNDRLSVRQGNVAFNLGSNTYSATNASASTPSLVVGEFGGLPQFNVNGGTLNTVHTSIAPKTVSNAGMTLNSGTWNNTGSIYVGGSSTAAGGKGSLTVAGGSLNLTGTLKVWGGGTVNYNGGAFKAGSIDVAAGGKVLLSSGGNKVLRSGNVTVAGSGKIDLSNNDAIFTSATYAAVETLLKLGFNGGNWLGNGITSSSAANDTNFVTALGIVNNATIHYSEFSGITGLTGGEILVKHTYYGDADIGGTVNLDDFNQFLFGFNPANAAPKIWLNGDFNYSGAVNLDDFNLFLFGLANQGGNLISPELFATLSQFVTAEIIDVDLAAVPEPGALWAALLMAGQLMRRRRAA